MMHAYRAGLSAIAVVALGASATAHAASNTSVTFKSNAETGDLSGKVKSAKEACISFRTVKNYRDRPGAPKQFKLYETATSDTDGTWSSLGPMGEIPPPGHYFVKVTKDEAEGCDAAKSKTIRIEHQSKAGSTPKLTIGTDAEASKLRGRVRSFQGGCDKGREVRIFWDEPGAPKDFELFTVQPSDDNGRWTAAPHGGASPGRYYAKTPKTGSCDAIKSKVLHVPSAR